MSKHIDYGVRTGGAVTWCREGGLDQAIKHIRNRRLGGFTAELVVRTRTDWEGADAATYELVPPRYRILRETEPESDEQLELFEVTP